MNIFGQTQDEIAIFPSAVEGADCGELNGVELPITLMTSKWEMAAVVTSMMVFI